MPEPTYRIAQALHARRAAVGLPKYGQHLTAASPGCMIVHAIEEAADLTEYLLAEAERRKRVLEMLIPLADWLTPNDPIAAAVDLLGGEAALAKYDEILGTVAKNATVAPEPTDNALPALLDELEAARLEMRRQGSVIAELREEVRRLTQANGDLRQERDRAVKEAQRQHGVAKGLRAELAAAKAKMQEGEGD